MASSSRSILNPSPTGKPNARLGGIELCHCGVGLELDLMLLVEAMLVYVGLRARRLSSQVVLCQWRAFVR